MSVAEREFQGDDGPAAVAVPDFQSRLFAVQLLQPRAGVCKADAMVLR
jgi:hypothetical protein